MFTLLRTDSSNPHFISLVSKLDEELAIHNGDENDFFIQFNTIDALKHVVLVYSNEKPVGCGAIKPFNEQSTEVKRMYVLPEFRGKRIAGQVLAELEKWTLELSYIKCVLETGIKQTEAITLYKRCGYEQTPRYEQYVNSENSLCFEKALV